MRLPPLNALRAFESAGRHESFARAATELHVSQGAVSRHIKLLEQHLGAELFRRHAQGVALTDRGRALLPELTAAFERIVRASRRVESRDNELKVISGATLAIRWLIPRLPRFQHLHPKLRVSAGLFTTCSYDEFYNGNFDLGIDCFDYKGARPRELDEVLLRREALTPVCAPSLLKASPRLLRPEDLAGHILLHPSHDHIDWEKWLRHAGLTRIDAQSGRTFDTMDMAVRAAANGLGVAIADLRLFKTELETGQIVAPFELVIREQSGYFLFCRKGRFLEPKIAALRDWLIAESESDD